MKSHAGNEKIGVPPAAETVSAAQAEWRFL